ncbi:hypothetical protein R3B00_001312 [Klebsiella pneumoniae]|nr:hypothetical protein [Klebsiella pneumoniae]ELQ8980650.1 hypothetical protein [Klebsiella pneumoniae]
MMDNDSIQRYLILYGKLFSSVYSKEQSNELEAFNKAVRAVSSCIASGEARHEGETITLDNTENPSQSVTEIKDEQCQLTPQHNM